MSQERYVLSGLSCYVQGLNHHTPQLLETEKRELQHLESQNAALESTVAKYQRRRELEKEVQPLPPYGQYESLILNMCSG